MGEEKNGVRIARTIGSVVGTIVKGGDGKPDRIVEKHIIHKDGEKEIIFINEERKKDLEENKSFEEYIDQFNKVEGKDKATFIKEHELKKLDQEVEEKPRGKDGI